MKHDFCVTFRQIRCVLDAFKNCLRAKNISLELMRPICPGPCCSLGNLSMSRKNRNHKILHGKNGCVFFYWYFQCKQCTSIHFCNSYSYCFTIFGVENSFQTNYVIGYCKNTLVICLSEYINGIISHYNLSRKIGENRYRKKSQFFVFSILKQIKRTS